MMKKKTKRLSKRLNNKKFFISLGVVFASVFALSLGACKFAIPKSIDIAMPKATYEVPLGKISTDKYFSSNDFYDHLASISDDFKVYDYIENGNSRDMAFLFEYDLQEIPIDFGEQLKKLDMDQKLSENLVQTIKIDKPEMPAPTSKQIDLNTTILNKMKDCLASIPTFTIPGGMSSAQTLTINGPTINFTDPEFATASFSSGSLNVIITPDSPDLGLVFSAKGKIVDYDTRRVITETQGAAVDCANGGTLSFPLTGKVFPKKTQIVLTATVNNPGSTTTCNSSATFTDEKLDRLTGVNMASISTINLNNTITFDTYCPLVSTILDSGSKVTIQAAAPDGWSGVNCEISGTANYEIVSGGLSIKKGDFGPGKNPGTYFIDKVANIEGATLTPNSINIVGEIAIDLVNATIVVPPSGIVDVAVNVDCDISNLGKTIVKKSAVFDSSKMTSSFGKSLGADANKYIKKVSFNNIDLICDFTGSDLPDNNLNVDATFTSKNLGIAGTGKSMTPENVKLGKNFTLRSPGKTAPDEYFYILADHADPIDSTKKGYVDAQVTIDVNDPDITVGTGNISFEKFVLGKEYTLKTTVRSEFDFNHIHLNASEMGAKTTGTKKTNLDINKLFTEAVGSGFDKTELDKLYFTGGRKDKGGAGATAYLYVSRPKTETEDDPFKNFKFKAKIQPMDTPDGETSTPLYYADNVSEQIFFKGSAKIGEEFENLDIKSDVLNLSGFTKVVEGRNVVTERKSKIFRQGSYSERIEEFADALNSKDGSNKRPQNLTIHYDLTIVGDDEGTPVSGEVIITGDQYKKMKTAADKDELKSMSIQMKLIIYSPMAFRIDDPSGKGFNIDDIADLTGDPLSDDFLGRGDKDDYDSFKDFLDAIKSLSLTYNSDYRMNSSLTLNLLKAVGDTTPALSKSFNITSTSENYVYFSHNDIDLILNSYPLIPKISMHAKNGSTIYVPRNMNISFKTQMVTEEGHQINVWKK